MREFSILYYTLGHNFTTEEIAKAEAFDHFRMLGSILSFLSASCDTFTNLLSREFFIIFWKPMYLHRNGYILH